MADRIILCTVYDRRSTLGLVRFRVARALEVLDPVFRGLFEKVGVAATPVEDATAFANAANREVDALFGE